jgi:ribulose-5-phosphate 4-epimerase/fuculose-1-phosphate aldolase
VQISETLANALRDLAKACRILEMEGHGDMTLGHLSLRDPDGRGFWMKRSRVGLGEIVGPEDFVLVDMDGNKIAGSGDRHSEWPIHSEVFRRRGDVQVVGHSHPFYASVFSASADPLAPYTLEADYFLDVPRHTDQVALITTRDEGASMAHTLGDKFVVLLANHGITFAGTSVAHATCVGVFFEKACKAHIVGQGAGFKATFPPRPLREKRHSQISAPYHFEQSWNYFVRKLDFIIAGNGGSQALYN